MKQPTCRQLEAITDQELLDWAREHYRDPYMGLEGQR
jgi:hypothetical protein